MSVEETVKAEVAAVEVKAETVAEAVATEVKAEVVKVEEAVKAKIVNIKAEEKLFLREAELEFLRAQMEIQRLTKIAEDKSKAYQAYIENLYKTYAITKVEYVFDGAVNAFKAL